MMNDNNCLHNDLIYPADCLEIFDWNDTKLITIGMYKYSVCDDVESQRNKSKRIGGLSIYEAKAKQEEKNVVRTTLKEPKNIFSVGLKNTFKTEYGILDIRQINKSQIDRIDFYTVCSDCSLRKFSLHESSGNMILDNKLTVPYMSGNKNSDVIGVAMDIFEQNNLAIFCCSDGIITLINGEKITNQWSAHNSEIWNVRFDPDSNGNIIASGADDCCLKIWDLRCELSQPIIYNSREHSMGVTCIAYSPWNSNELYTGCYDQKLRIWDVRSIRSPINKLETSGGIWRLNFHKDLMLVATCDGGAEIWSYDKANYRRLIHYVDHKSMVYGIGLLAYTPPQKQQIYPRGWCATCSFYDQKLNIWDF